MKKKQTSVLRLTENSVIPTYDSMKQLAQMEFETSKIVQEWTVEWNKQYEKKKQQWETYNKLKAQRDEEIQKWNMEEQEIIKSNEEMVKQFKKK